MGVSSFQNLTNAKVHRTTIQHFLIRYHLSKYQIWVGPIHLETRIKIALVILPKSPVKIFVISENRGV